MDVQKLKEAAGAVLGWSNCDKAWLDTSEDESAAVFGHIDEDGNTYPVATIDCDQYYQGQDSLKLARFYAAANPAKVLDLITEIEQLRAEINEQARLLGISAEKELALRAENEELKRKLDFAEAVIAGDGALITGLKAELAEAKKDAERYRWLRDEKFDGYRWAVLLGVTVRHSSNGINNAIDEAMKGK